jgi:hypothetical protein
MPFKRGSKKWLTLSVSPADFGKKISAVPSIKKTVMVDDSATRHARGINILFGRELKAAFGVESINQKHHSLWTGRILNLKSFN